MAENLKKRNVKQIISPQFVMEGAGVRLRRSFPGAALDYPDPFLLFDHFGSDDPADYLAGFPMHPHRGIETVTYMLAGAVKHQDSIGNAGTIGAGDVQWMTAGRGILHEEMPEPVDGYMEGFQLWVNLPAELKMTAPNYQEVKADEIPEFDLAPGVSQRVIVGEVNGHAGPVKGIAAEPVYLDVSLAEGADFSYPVPADHTVLVYLYRGGIAVGEDDNRRTAATKAPALFLLENGGIVSARSTGGAARFLVMSGRPLNEPIFRYGPFVMNTRQEIEQTLRELRNGTFIQK
jgi:redox-sensitive bicupin YhaK (pirin superfamily)